MKHTGTNEFNSLVKGYLLPIVEQKLQDYEQTTEKPFTWVIETARGEVPHEFSRHGQQAGLASWLAGLGMNIDCYNSEIIARAEYWHDCELTHKQAETVVANWFQFVAVKIIQIARKEQPPAKRTKK